MEQYDVIVVGAGPAGLGAAITCGRAGAKTVLMDENHLPGGQLFKQIHKFFGSREHYAGTRGFQIGEQLLKEAEEENVEIRLDTRVWGIYEDHTVTAVTTEGTSFRCRTKYIVLATGASENGLVFPGNTLPGVITAGAAQTMVNLRGVCPGKRVVVVGSGNVGLIVSYQLMQAGMEVAAIVEAAPKITGYAVHAGKVRRAGVPILLSHTILEARGHEELEEVVICKVDKRFAPVKGSEQVIKADTLCLAVGLTPRSELAAVSGCNMCYNKALGGRIPAHSALLQTSAEYVFIAGDLSGIEEASTALDEGRLAGTCIAGLLGLIEEARLDEQIECIQRRIQTLRQGNFGTGRRLAKEEIWKSFEKKAGAADG